MELKHLLQAILAVSEKAAVLARAIRSEHSLFELLIEEKSNESKNKRFLRDFKTLADVLVQELVKSDLSRQFPGIESQIYGEESNTFTNTLGESVCVQIKENPEEMTELLSLVLDGNQKAAGLLTNVIHGGKEGGEMRVPGGENVKTRVPDQLLMDTENIALWIDPIDSTAQYIHGYESEMPEGGVYTEGLQCAVILIGVYHRGTGEPILGVANQPFCTQTDKRWTGRAVWGLSYNGVNVSSLHTQEDVKTTEEAAAAVVQSDNVKSIRHASLIPTVVLSASENSDLQRRLGSRYKLVYAAGAGYKQLCVIDSLVSAYFLSKGSTFKWDTCAPHAILKSLGGGIVDFKKALEFVGSRGGSERGEEGEGVWGELRRFELVYHRVDREGAEEGEKWSNAGGMIAYTNPQEIIHIAKCLITEGV